MKTFLPKEKDIQTKTYLIDAEGKTLGRMASKIAQILMGKDKPYYVKDRFVGDHIVVINATKVKITGNKEEKKIYTSYSGYPGGLKSWTFEELMERHPDQIIRKAVQRMLPKNSLGREMGRRIRVFAGAEHNQQSQKPIPLEV